MRRGKLICLCAILLGCGGRTDTLLDENGNWTYPSGGADPSTDSGGEDGIGGNIVSQGGLGGSSPHPTPISGGITWTYTTAPSSGSVPITIRTTVSRGGATSWYAGGGTTWIPPYYVGGYGGTVVYPGGGRIGAGGAIIYPGGGRIGAGGFIGRGGASPVGGYSMGGKAGAPPLGGFAGVYLGRGGAVPIGGSSMGGWATTATIAFGGYAPIGGRTSTGGTSGIVGLLLQACNSAVADPCMQCQCKTCTPKAVDCANDSGCVTLIECASRNSCTDLNCFLTGPCSSVVASVGGLSSAAVTHAAALVLCPMTSNCGC